MEPIRRTTTRAPRAGVLLVSTPAVTACRNGPRGTDGKHARISTSELVDRLRATR